MAKAKFLLNFLEALKDFPQDLKTLRKHERMSRAMSYQSWMSDGVNSRGIKNLKARGIIYTQKSGFGFTKSGVRWLEKSNLRYLRLKNKKWDGKWRIIIFDIPQHLHSKRNWLRTKMKNLGFYMLQKSVFVFPYPCEGELGDICSMLNISDYIDIIVADSIGFRERAIKKHFEL